MKLSKDATTGSKVVQCDLDNEAIFLKLSDGSHILLYRPFITKLNSTPIDHTEFQLIADKYIGGSAIGNDICFQFNNGLTLESNVASNEHLEAGEIRFSDGSISVIREY
jgi:hypothetical protein